MKIALLLVSLAVTAGAWVIWNLTAAPSRDAALPLGGELGQAVMKGPQGQVADEVLGVEVRSPRSRETSSDSPSEPTSESAVSADSGSAVQVSELLPPQVPDGTAIVGRLVDSGGQPVLRGHLEISSSESPRQLRLKADPAGRFAVAVEQSGDITLAARADNVGRSRELAVHLPEGQATDVGDLQLIGAGVIRGHLRFPGGGAVPGLSIHAKAVDPRASPGLRSSETESAENGSFELTGLAPGRFGFNVSKDEELPLISSDIVQAGDQDADLVVDAALLRISCVQDDGERVPLKSLELSNVLDADDMGSTSRMFGRAVDGFDLVVKTNRAYLIEAFGNDRKPYFAYLRGGLPAGVHVIELRHDLPSLGGLRLLARPGSLPEGARVSLGRARRNGQQVRGSLLAHRVQPGAVHLEMLGLIPGRYEVTPSLRGAEWTALTQPRYTFELAAGEMEEINLETWEGGRLELYVRRQRIGEHPTTRASVSIRPSGDTGWAVVQLSSERDGSSTVGDKIWIDGTLARSQVLAEGSYQVRVEAGGHLTADAEVVIRPGIATVLELSLREE